MIFHCETFLEKIMAAGLVDSPELLDMKIMGAIMNPLFQCNAGMVEAGTCTWKQFEAKKEMLVDRMTHYYDRTESVVTAMDESLVKKTNKKSKLKHPTLMLVICQESVCQENSSCMRHISIMTSIICQ